MQIEENINRKLHKLEGIMIEALHSNNIFAMDHELKEIWDNKEDDLWDNL